MKLEGISKTFIAHKEEIKVLDNITYKFEMGKFYAIMGHSGSGKSTLINILGMLENADTGKYYLNGKLINDLSDEVKTELRRDNIGLVFQEFYLDENLNALENVILPMLINSKINKSDRKKKALELLTKVGLESRVKHLPRELSGGEMQRVCIARALANDPQIILADEPTGNLDVKAEKGILENLKKLSEEGKCVIVVSHSPKVKSFADKVLELSEGKLK